MQSDNLKLALVNGRIILPRAIRSMMFTGIGLAILLISGAPVAARQVIPVSPASGPGIFILGTNLADYPGGKVPRFSKFEITLSLDRTYTNPFDPHEIQVDGYFTSPEHAISVQPGFYYQAYQMTRIDDQENYTPSGNPVWKVRFTPSQVGMYQYHLVAGDQNGIRSTTTLSFEVAASGGVGFIRVSKTNSRYFEFDSGDPFIGFGLNVAWWKDERQRLATFEYFLSRMSTFKANLARVWMTNSGRDQNWIMSIQDDQLGSNYDLEEAWAFDKILDLARQNGVYFILTLDDVNQYIRNWPDNLYNSALGGPCSYPSAIFTDPQARLYQQRIFRYIVARWGYSPNILSWELFNEIDELQWSDESHWSRQAMIEWHVKMADYLATIDTHRHLINTSTGSFKTNPDLYGSSLMDFAEIHVYFVQGCCNNFPSDPAGRDIADLTHYYSYRVYHSVTGKPSLIGESGLLNENWIDSPYLDLDDLGVHLHDGLWSSLMSGMASTSLSWHWNSHQAHDPTWWQHYSALASYFSNLSVINLTVMKPLNVDFSLPGGSDSESDAFASSNSQLRVMGLRNGSQVYAWVQNKNHTWWNYTHAIADTPQSGTITIYNLTPGRNYILEKWETYTPTRQIIDQETLTVQENGSLSFSVNNLQSDIAFKLRPVVNLPLMTLITKQSKKDSIFANSSLRNH